MTGYAETSITTGKFVRRRLSDGAWWNTSGTPAFEAYNAANIASYGTAATETGATGVYTATDPSDTTVGDYLFIKAAGASLAVADVATGVRWEQTAGPLGVDLQTIKTQTVTCAAGVTVLASVGGASAPGTSGGILISGSNSGTTTFGALTVTGGTTFTGNVSAAAGVTITQSTTNGAGLSVTGNGTGAGAVFIGGATGAGLTLTGGSTSGDGLLATTTSGHGFNITAFGSGKHGIASGGGTNGSGISFDGNGNGHGILSAGGSTSGSGMRLIGAGSGHGLMAVASGTGNGFVITGGSTSGDGLVVTTTSGHGFNVTATGASKHGAVFTGGNSGTSDGFKAVAGTGGVPIRGDITGNLSGSVGSVSGVTFPTNFASLSIDASGRIDLGKILGTASAGAVGYVGIDWGHVNAPTTTLNLSGTTIATTQKVDIETIKTNPVVNAGTITFPTTATLASTTNITAGTMTTTTNATNISAGGIVTASFAAGTTIPRVTLADTLTTYTNNTPQSGDSYARIGSTGSGLTSLAPASTALSTDTWTSALATYVANLNVGGPVASQADIDALNQSASRTLILQTVPAYERPETGTTLYTVEARTFDPADGQPVNADSTPTLTATGSISGNLSANLSAATSPSTGVYQWTYTVATAAVLEQVTMGVSAVISTVTYTLNAYTQVADTVSATFTSTDQANLTAIFNKLPVNNIADETLVLAAVGTPMQAYTQPTGFLAATFPGTVASTTNITAGTVTNATNVTNLTNAPTAGDFTATMKTSLNAATPASTGAIGAGGITTASFAGGTTIPRVTLADTATNLTNAATSGDLTAAMKTSVTTAATAATPTAAAVSGAVGSVGAGGITTATFASGATVPRVTLVDTTTVLTNLPAITTDWITATGLATSAVNEIQSGLATSTALGSVQTDTTAIKAKTDNLPASPAATGDIPTVDQIWAKTMGELAGVPAINAAALDKLQWAFTMMRNKVTQTATVQTVLKDDGSTTLATSTMSDDGTTFSRGKFA